MSYTVDILVPLTRDGGARDENWSFLRQLWRQQFPSWGIRICPGDADHWSKGVALWEGALHSLADVLVVADADVWVNHHKDLSECVRKVHTGQAPWAVPHTLVYRLDQDASRRWTYGQDLMSLRPGYTRAPYVGITGGGVFVIRREDFLDIGGVDPRFVGWGGEDEAFGVCADTLLGRRLRLKSALVHLWHPHQVSKSDIDNRKRNAHLAKVYLTSRGNQPRMRRLIAQAAHLRQ